MKQKLLLFIILLATSYASAQMGVGTDMPDPAAELEVKSNNRGLLIPRISLTGSTDQTTITAGNVNSLLVYNTSTNATLTPGFYYWYNDRWRRLSDSVNLPENIVTWDETFNRFLYTDAQGTIHEININPDNEVTLVNNNDGTYTFTDAQGQQTLIDTNHPETLTKLGISSDQRFLLYEDEHNQITSVDLETAVKSLETLTSLIDNNDGTFSYTDESGNTTTFDFKNYETLTKLVVNPDQVHIDYTAEDGVTYQLDLTALVKNLETSTQLQLNPDGKTLEYIDEDGTTQSLDLENIIHDNQQTFAVQDGTNTTTTSSTTGNHTDYQVHIPIADDTQLGVVKQADTDPTVLVNAQGELAINLDAANKIHQTSVNYTATLDIRVILVDAGSGDVEITLPTPDASNRGKIYTIKKEDDSEDHYVNVIGNIAHTGGQDLYTAVPHTGWDLISDGNHWRIINKY